MFFVAPPTDDDSLLDRRSCQLLGPTALVGQVLLWNTAQEKFMRYHIIHQIVQALMGVLVILSLVYKRHREPQKRPWRIWFVLAACSDVGEH